MVPERSVTLDVLGAWVIKCNPAKTPLGPMRAAGETKPHWCVADNYRSHLMRSGQRVLFWVSAHPQRGLWGAGHLAGEPAVEDGRLHVAVHIPLFAQPVPAADLAAVAGLRSIEVFRSPQQSNPSWVSVDELALIDPLLPVT